MSLRDRLRVYLVTDPSARIGVVETAVAAARGGATMVQLRDKSLSDDDFVALGRALKRALAPFAAPLIVNDRHHLTRAIGADGAHVGQTDAAPSAVRAGIGREAILGLSIETEAQLQAVDWALIDYVGAGPVRGTPTKPDHAAPVGFDGLARICAAARKPVVAIGGLSIADAAAVRAAGAQGLAVVSAICGADDPEAAARAALTAWEEP